ncbi:ABC transporter permease [Fictibacillus phosphorivorans]|uniref:ABC transporter permease n=1 Tax=Fictibacillus phosphorivorans TaxID=1221500 RepID=A0A163SDY0_9BACL|nr:ABC transporter permease [Fictibacillus phosphorivorans]KZE68838.1 ABC transporter permease [Fictibacillus phosphorivorans]
MISETQKWKVGQRASPQKLSSSKGLFRVGKGFALGSILPIILLIAWEIAARVGLLAPHLLPAPSIILEKIISMYRDGSLFGHVSITLTRVLLGFAIGTAAAVVIGAIVGYAKTAEQVLDPLFQAFRSIPSLAWVPLFILWMGIGEPSKISLIAVGVFFPVYLNIVAGIQGVDRKLIEVGRIYQLTPFQLTKRIILPAALPSFITGMRSGLGLGWMFVVAAELMGASEGLGYLLVVGQNTYSPDTVIASILLFAILGKGTDALLKWIEYRSLKWQDSINNQA